MRSLTRVWVLVVSAAGAGSGCSLLTSFDGVDLGVLPSAHDASTGAPDGATDGAAPTDSSVAEAAPPFSCMAGDVYCGGDHNPYTTDSDWLFVCNSAGKALVKTLECNHGCITRPGLDDVCSCIASSPYCGGDQVIGPPNDLYVCGANDTPTLQTTCANGCMVNAGANDACK